MSGDMELKQHVEDELSWEPSVNAAAIGVAVKDAIVTLSGHVKTFAERHAAEQAVLRIRGVRALANELEVKLLADDKRTDEDIARTVASILDWNPSIPKGRIKIQVSDGWVKLEGVVDWYYQRSAAGLSVQGLMGVKGIINQLTVRSAPIRNEVKSQIEAALKRSAEIDARRINVMLEGNKVILSGTVSSLSERDAAERAAWKAAGVGWVENDLAVSPTTSVFNAA